MNIYRIVRTTIVIPIIVLKNQSPTKLLERIVEFAILIIWWDSIAMYHHITNFFHLHVIRPYQFRHHSRPVA